MSMTADINGLVERLERVKRLDCHDGDLIDPGKVLKYLEDGQKKLNQIVDQYRTEHRLTPAASAGTASRSHATK